MKFSKMIATAALAVCFIGVAPAFGVSASADTSGAVNIPDPTLKAQIIETLELSSSTVTEADMRQLVSLETPDNDPANMITDLTGLEYAVNLQELDLDYNKITDLSPLKELKNLKKLDISYNNGAVQGTDGITDLSPLAGLTGLEYFSSVGNDGVSDYGVVSKFTELSYLNLSICGLEDISFLSGLTSLENLYLAFNDIYDILPLQNVTALKKLALGNNRLQDISVVANMSGLTQFTVENNYIEDFSPVLGLDALNYLDVSRNFLSDEQMGQIMESLADAETVYVSPVADDSKRAELICLNAYEKTMYVGDTFTLKATDFGDSVLEGTQFSSTNASVASVDASGNITAVGTGFCYISATYNGYSRLCGVTVTTDDKDPGTPGEPEEPRGGCSGSAVGAAGGLGGAVLAGAAVVLAVRRKKC